jgi:hypothetical protein
MVGYLVRQLQEAAESGDSRKIGILAEMIIEDSSSNSGEIQVACLGLALAAPQGSAQQQAYQAAGEGRGSDPSVQTTLRSSCGTVGAAAAQRLRGY